MNSTVRTTRLREPSLILLIQAAVGLTWLRSGVERLADQHSVPGMRQMTGGVRLEGDFGAAQNAHQIAL